MWLNLAQLLCSILFGLKLLGSTPTHIPQVSDNIYFQNLAILLMCKLLHSACPVESVEIWAWFCVLSQPGVRMCLKENGCPLVRQLQHSCEGRLISSITRKEADFYSQGRLRVTWGFSPLFVYNQMPLFHVSGIHSFTVNVLTFTWELGKAVWIYLTLQFCNLQN